VRGEREEKACSVRSTSVYTSVRKAYWRERETEHVRAETKQRSERLTGPRTCCSQRWVAFRAITLVPCQGIHFLELIDKGSRPAGPELDETDQLEFDSRQSLYSLASLASLGSLDAPSVQVSPWARPPFLQRASPACGTMQTTWVHVLLAVFRASS
jgi:hypothetical protein